MTSIPWIRIDSGFLMHPKVDALDAELGMQGQSSGFHLLSLWTWAASVKADGDLSGISDSAIATRSRWAGDPVAFVAALLSSGWVDGPPGARVLHGWRDRYEKVLVKMERDRERKSARGSSGASGGTSKGGSRATPSEFQGQIRQDLEEKTQKRRSEEIQETQAGEEWDFTKAIEEHMAAQPGKYR